VTAGYLENNIVEFQNLESGFSRKDGHGQLVLHHVHGRGQ
jgi:hypothetical protein